MIGQMLFHVGLVLVLAGFALTLGAFLLLVLKTMKERGKVRGGGVVMMGPLPIVFGTGMGLVRALLILSIALVVFLLLLTVLSAEIPW